MLSEYVKTADWKNEKHVPVIDCPTSVAAGAPLAITVTVGKEIAHPNTPSHFIAWVALHFVPAGSTASVEIARCEFSAHGAAAGDAKGPACTVPMLTVSATFTTPGKLYATAYCNIHGLWASEQEIALI